MCACVQVLGTVKNAALVIFCVIFLGESVTGLQGLGYSVALVGFSWYQLVKMAKSPATEGARLKHESSRDGDDVVPLISGKGQASNGGSADGLIEWVSSSDLIRLKDRL